MANVVIGKIEVALEDVFHWLTSAKTFVIKSPTILAALVTILVAVGKVVEDVKMDFSNPIAVFNIPLSGQQLTDIKSVWADIKELFLDFGWKI